MATEEHPSTTVRLEVQSGKTSDGNLAWRDAGTISLLDEGSEQTVLLNQTISERNDTNLNLNQDASVSPSSTVHTPRRQLPKATKQCLAPNVTSKNKRQEIYLFRHAQNNSPNTNLIIFLHGAGDTHRPYDRLGQSMALPQTATLSLHATQFAALPFGLGHSWFHEMDYTTGAPLPSLSPVRLESLHLAVEKCCSLIESIVQDNNGWVPERVFLMGYGAGACLAMELCKTWGERGGNALGGAICISGGCVPVQSEGNRKDKKKSKQNSATPVLIVAGSRDDAFPPAEAQKSKMAYGVVGCVQLHVQPNKGRGMISSQEEMKVVMEFLAKRLVRFSQMGSNAVNTEPF